MNYPILMVRGNAFIPKRFWNYVTVFNEEQYENLIKKGFIISNLNGNV
jgi:DNA/RNA endonuclease G (NUC1)